ncbi:hypothetical protein D3C73_1585730 [compost metagenome]
MVAAQIIQEAVPRCGSRFGRESDAFRVDALEQIGIRRVDLQESGAVFGEFLESARSPHRILPQGSFRGMS